MPILDSKKCLYERYQNNQLAQVYLAHYPAHSDALLWVKDFISLLTPLEDHPDILVVKRNEKENNYKVESPGILELLKFVNYRPLKLKQRFIFVTDAHLLSEIVSNKLLKLLEELPPHFCLFLLCPEGQNLLPTVKSRAINLPITPSNVSSNEEAEENFESVFDFVQFLKTCTDPSYEEKKFIEKRIDLFLSKNPGYAQCEEWLTNLKLYAESAEYNNAKTSRLSLFFP